MSLDTNSWSQRGPWESPEATPLSRLSVPLREEPLCSLLCSELFTHFTYYPHNSHKVCALWTSSHRSGNWGTGRLSNQLWRVTVCGREPWQCGSRPSVLPTPQPLCCTAYSYSPPCLVVFNLLWEVKKFSQILQNLLEMYFLCTKGWLPQICPK